MSSAGARFPKSSRLLKHADFDLVYQNGKRQFSGHMTVFSLPRDTGAPRVGFTVGRVLGGAVVRNRIKRRLREAVRRNLHALSAPVDLVINPKKSVLTLEFALLEAEIAKTFAKIGRPEDKETTQTRRHGEKA
jgi:ribonuclease P protein component